MFEFETKNYFFHYNTLDIDYEIPDNTKIPVSKETINRIVALMRRCKFLVGLVKEPSCKKGYHIRYYCSIKCDKCRMVFDDAIRFNADVTRKKEFTNIMFDKKGGF